MVALASCAAPAARREGGPAIWRGRAVEPFTSGEYAAVPFDRAVLSSSGQLLFTHSIAVGADQLQASEPAKLRWVGELVRLPRILLHEDMKGRLGRGVITGVTEGLGSLVEQLTGQWGVSVEVMDSLAPWTPSTSVTHSAAASRVSFTALAGLMGAGRPPRIDLIPKEARVLQALQVRSKHLTRLAASVAAIVLFIPVLYGERIIVLQRYRASLQRRLDALESTTQQVTQRQQTMRAIRQWLDPVHSPLEVFRRWWRANPSRFEAAPRRWPQRLRWRIGSSTRGCFLTWMRVPP
jgi:hypothetical protein